MLNEEQKAHLKEFWRKEHLANHDKRPTYVSQTPGRKIWNDHEIKPYLKLGAKVLEIGIGRGQNVRELHGLGAKVWGIDITPEAFDCVKGLLEQTWLDTELEDLPDDKFDLAISHLVTQHLVDDDVIAQINNVVRSLKKDGIFTMQFAKRVGLIESVPETMYLAKGGGLCRSLGEMERLVDAAGARVERIKRIENFEKQKSVHYVVHIKKKDAK